MLATKINIDALETAERDELLEQWRHLFKTPPPRLMSRAIMCKLIAFEVQAKVYGGLDQHTRRVLKQYEQSFLKNKTIRTKARQFSKGTRLLREWNGVTHLVMVQEAGYRWKDRTYRSLSAIAKEITGTHWSGPRFFCLKERERDGQNGAGKEQELVS